jgi:hypothetical protein
VLLPAHVLIGSQVDTYAKTAADASVKVADYQQAAADLASASRLARLAIDSARPTAFSSYVSLLQAQQRKDIVLREIAITRTQAEGVQPIRVVGQAQDRQSLASFRDRLLAQDEIAAVDLPISSLAQDRDIEFNLTVTLSVSQQYE